MNTKLLLEAKEQILKEPLQFDMDSWFKFGDHIPNCGTAACIGGWVLTLAEKVKPREKAKEIRSDFGVSTNVGGGYNDSMLDQVKLLLDLNQEQVLELCFTNCWPVEYVDRYEAAETKQQKAQVAADYIDYFIERYSAKVST